MNRPRALLEYLPLWLFARIMAFVPRRLALAAGRVIGLAVWACDSRHRRVAVANLEKAYGDAMSSAQRLKLTRQVFSHFGTVAADCLLMSHRRPSDIETLIDYEGVDNIRNAFLKGKGVLVFSGHFGNWELVALLQGWLGYPMAMITRPLDNPLLENFFRFGRTRSGNEVIHKHRAARGILRALRHGWCVAIVIDQDTRGTDHVFVDFFGRPAATTSTLARLALRTGAPIVPVFGIPLPGGRYRITYLPEMQLPGTGDQSADVVALTQACTRIIEEQIRAQPEAWLWMHRRWKRHPEHPRQTTDRVLVDLEKR